ncbi:MAG: 3-methyl-2-oxobutanoate dehydrogenase subunit beta, partial [Desulfopila sp.]|nr:3-methyl-2-oxobutanoate dehydrogenase subunit beta [Desulfopila sp.]
RRIVSGESRWEAYRIKDAEVVVVAYGTTSRIVKNAIDLLAGDIAVGLIRPQTLWPFPVDAFAELPQSCQKILCVEMSCGQMIDDVRLAVAGRKEVFFYGRSGGMVPTPGEIADAVRQLAGRINA